ncbi:MAG: hypothetical protein WD076_00010 [Parvularculaceae bacterium]
MTIAEAEMLLAAVGVYLAIGVVFALIFAFGGAARVDHAAEGAAPWFRIVIIPGVVGLWPIMALRLLSGRRINAPIAHEGDAP